MFQQAADQQVGKLRVMLQCRLFHAVWVRLLSSWPQQPGPMAVILEPAEGMLLSCGR